VLIYEENKRKEKDAAKICLEKIAEHKLEMKLVDVEYTFDNNKLLFYFTAEGRVDFRELVKSLASIFRTRIELRQIGIRDETKLIGGLGVCGRPFCCKKFLDDFCQVSIKMAKEQNLSLNSQKISGACGRLMCCLRFEHELYEEELAKLPKLDALVETPDGRGIVCELSPLCGLVKVRFGGEHQTIRTYAKDSVKIIANSKKEQKELRESEGKAQGKKDN
jgi:cell fate regulator YaaT (PSP1 superfamily)